MLDEPLAASVHRTSRLARVDGGTTPVRIVGPYWAKHAALVPVGSEHLVVFGGPDPLDAPDATLVPIATQLVAGLQQVSPTKLLADELEIVHAIRDLMDYRPERLIETARHVALKAAEPLSCEVGAVLVRTGGKVVVEVITRDWPARLDPADIRATLVRLFEQVGNGPFLEPELEAAADDALGREQGLVARLALPIGRPEPFGVLVVAHAATHSRGFTNVCQRIGQALADAAESLLVQAMTREELAAERDQFAREARTDALTGLPNRLAWREILEAEEGRRSRYGHPVAIVSADLDELKETNDRSGHVAGDRLICTAAGLLKQHARSVDRVARVGGDEFYVLLPETDAAGAARYVARLRAAARRTRVDGTARLRLSVGVATPRDGESLAAALERADAAMYTSKRRRDR
jgi:diguanylate cyclase (GGDEF)-like protein